MEIRTKTFIKASDVGMLLIGVQSTETSVFILVAGTVLGTEQNGSVRTVLENDSRMLRTVLACQCERGIKCNCTIPFWSVPEQSEKPSWTVPEPF